MNYIFTTNHKRKISNTDLHGDTYDDYEHNDDSWQLKSKRLQARRWRKIRDS